MRSSAGGLIAGPVPKRSRWPGLLACLGVTVVLLAGCQTYVDSKSLPSGRYREPPPYAQGPPALPARPEPAAQEHAAPAVVRASSACDTPDAEAIRQRPDCPAAPTGAARLGPPSDQDPLVADLKGIVD